MSAVEKNLIGYLLEALEPDEMRSVASYLAEHPEAAQQLDTLRLALHPLDADRLPEEAPHDLFMRTLGTVAEHIVASEDRVNAPRETPVTDFIRNYTRLVDGVDVPDGLPAVSPAYSLDRPLPSGSREARRNVIAGIGLSLALLAIVVPGVLAFREQQRTFACQNNLRMFHQGLIGYSDIHDGQLPQIEEKQVAGAFASILHRAGQLPPQAQPTCPATGHGGAWFTSTGALVPDAMPNLIEYAYPLGYRDSEGVLHGVVRTSEPDGMPVLADSPTPALPPRQDGTATATNHRRGQNVLFLGGQVKFCTNALVGVDADNIFCNDERRINAGVRRWDSVLGRADEPP
jgi:hypothetical protein